jgi:multisubunit Na+/H+ antiporter MnhG subunit
MNYPEPILTTEPAGDGMTFTARYETPETARMMDSLRGLSAGTVGLAMLLAGFALHGRNFHDWLIGPAILSAALIIIASYFAAQLLARALYGRRFFLRSWTDARLDMTLTRKSVTYADKSYGR